MIPLGTVFVVSAVVIGLWNCNFLSSGVMVPLMTGVWCFVMAWLMNEVSKES